MLGQHKEPAHTYTHTQASTIIYDRARDNQFSVIRVLEEKNG